jgi:hypothetical protein
MRITNRTSTYIATIPMKSIEQVIEVKETLEQIFGWVVLKGRHSDRKSVLTNWRKFAQNDVPWRKAEYIDIYLHPKNPNYQSVNKGNGIRRANMIGSLLVPRVLGKHKQGFYDGWVNEQETKKNPIYQAIQTMKTPKNSPHSKKPYGAVTQQIWSFMNSIGEATFTEMKTFYDVDIRGNSSIIDGGSFIHHLQSLRNPSKKRGWYLSKQINGKYALRISK